MNVKDINQTKPLHYAPRCSNPLNPEYKVSTTATTSLHTKFTEELEALNSSLKMWEDLRKSCESEGVKPEERAAKRQAEVKALKEALGVLNQVTAH